MKAMISADMKQMNRKIVFDIIRKEREITRVELAEITGMSGPSILTIVNEFIDKGILEKVSEKSTSVGRRPVVMRFNPDVMLSIGIEYEGNNLSVGVVNLDGEIRFQTVSRVPVNMGKTFFEVIEKSISKMEDLLAKENLDYCGIGLGIPGAVEGEKKIIYFAPYIGVNKPLDISAELDNLEKRFKKPIFIENDVNACAIGEFYIRKTTEIGKDLLYISIGAGIGAGIILNKELRHGSNHLCGEIGYSLPDVDCEVSREKAGWLEESLSFATLCEKSENYRLRYEMDSEIIDYITNTICPYIANLANTLDMNFIVIGGELALNGGDALIRAIQHKLARLTLSKVQVQSCKGDYAGVTGTALIASNNLFDTIL